MGKVIRNRLDRAFGPVGLYAGLTLIIIGIIGSFFSLVSIILIIIGAFTGLTFSCTYVDYENKRMKFSNNFFGLIPIGDWINIKPNMKIGIKKSKNYWKSYSRSNRIIKVPNVDYRLTLYNFNNREILTIKKYDDYDRASADKEETMRLLGLTSI